MKRFILCGIAALSLAFAPVGASAAWTGGVLGRPLDGGYAVLVPTPLMTPALAAHRAPLPADWVFAGDDPAAPVQGAELLFANEAAARAALGAWWVEPSDG